MALSQLARDYLAVALANKKISKEVADAIDSGSNLQAASVAAIGATSNLSALVPAAQDVAASNAVLSTGDTYSDAAVKTAIDGAVDAAAVAIEGFLLAKADNADVETLRTEAEARLDAIEAKIDAVILALKNADLMA